MKKLALVDLQNMLIGNLFTSLCGREIETDIFHLGAEADVRCVCLCAQHDSWDLKKKNLMDHIWVEAVPPTPILVIM